MTTQTSNLRIKELEEEQARLHSELADSHKAHQDKKDECIRLEQSLKVHQNVKDECTKLEKSLKVQEDMLYAYRSVRDILLGELQGEASDTQAPGENVIKDEAQKVNKADNWRSWW